jgi:hypothetical protein
MVLSNDATALILTPIVYVLVTKLRFTCSALSVCLYLHCRYRQARAQAFQPSLGMYVNTLLELGVFPALPGGMESRRISGMKNCEKSRYGDPLLALD